MWNKKYSVLDSKFNEYFDRIQDMYGFKRIIRL